MKISLSKQFNEMFANVNNFINLEKHVVSDSIKKLHNNFSDKTGENKHCRSESSLAYC